MSKLVRDKIPEIIKTSGINPKIRIANPLEYKKRLHEKLKEEVEEFLQSETEEELADILEVLYGIIEQKQTTLASVEEIRKKKLKDRGGFKKRIILED